MYVCSFGYGTFVKSYYLNKTYFAIHNHGLMQQNLRQKNNVLVIIIIIIIIIHTFIYSAVMQTFRGAYIYGWRLVSVVCMLCMSIGVPRHRAVCQAAVSNRTDSYTSRSRVRLYGRGEGR